MKKIENNAARRITFSKRRRVLSKKAEELSTLCDAQIALLVFSASGNLSEYANPSMQQIFERYDLHTIDRIQHPFEELQVAKNNYNAMRKELADKTLEQRHLNGEDLEGLKIKELQKLEKLLAKGLTRVSIAKDAIIQKNVIELKKKGVELGQDNRRLKQIQSVVNDKGQSSGPNMIPTGPSNGVQDSDDASLNLGLALFK